jgi:hypothetical protein
MALTVTEGTMYQEQPAFRKVISVAFDSSYPTGGEDLDHESYDPNGGVFLGAMCEADGTYHFVYDETNKKLMAIVTATGAEVANTTDLSALTAVPVVVLFA